MAFTTTKSTHSFNLMRAIYGALATVGHAMMRPADAKAENARRQISHLRALSDAELEARGIRREDIEYRVFSGSYYA
ncbi:DUF1127 domain-containing protein [Pseudohalocynthiibacter aestuariivivens]|uniref:DUF1127 domain-containing protein n=1 Tax=Roseovarius pelagicus TaxID=2980108 RepID=A0ABY6DE81_9RHOB|nr:MULTISPECIES: DUF1127 domain-containing protein [Rhodobacterales]QIE46988.1 DUF1127 domain-containing protein [Pseudohalocynthiibacter aestuariivivens]UXX84462.1 DUF1127 domain-containing protein [Roseovarius pelagicus]